MKGIVLNISKIYKTYALLLFLILNIKDNLSKITNYLYIANTVYGGICLYHRVLLIELMNFI